MSEGENHTTDIGACPAAWQAYRALKAGRPEQCLQWLESGDPVPEPLLDSLLSACRGILAERADDAPSAARHFGAVSRIGVPLVALNRGQDAAEATASLPAVQQRIRDLFYADRPLFYRAQKEKAALADAFGDVTAALVVAEALDPALSGAVRRLPMDSLQRYALEHALVYEEIVPPRAVRLSGPELFGAEAAPPVTGRSRSVFLCQLADMTVHSKSNLLRAPDRMLLDWQGSELSDIPIHADTYPEVMAHLDDGSLLVLEAGEASATAGIETGFDLTGLHTWAFGHWIVEFMFQVWTCLDRPELEGVPLIIDEKMPPQLAEMLRFFAGPQRPFVVVPAGGSVRVERLWACSKIVFWPGGERFEEARLEFELSDFDAMRRVLGPWQTRLDAVADHGMPRKLYLTRAAEQGRALVNREAVEALFREAGFTVLNFNGLSFHDQLRHLRGADTVVLEAGSSIYNLVFCRPGTRIGELVGPPMTEYLWVAEMCRALDLKLLMFPFDGALERPDEAPVGGQRANIDLLGSYLEAMEAL